MFSYINERLRGISLNYDLVYTSCKTDILKKIGCYVILTIMCLAISYFIKLDTNLIVCDYILSLLLFVNIVKLCIRLHVLVKLEPYSDDATAFVIMALNNPSHMKKLLKGNKNKLSDDLLLNANINEISPVEKRSIKRYIKSYQIEKEIFGVTLTSLVIGLLFHFNLINTVPSDNHVIKILFSVLLAIGLRLVVPNRSIKYLYYHSLDKHMYGMFRQGIISNYQYKYFTIFMCDLRNEILFNEEDITHLSNEEIIPLTEVIATYSKYNCLGIFKLAVGVIILISVMIAIVNSSVYLYCLFGFCILTIISALVCLYKYKHDIVKWEIPKKDMNTFNRIITEFLPREFLDIV